MARLPEPHFAPDCTISVDGREIPARSGESVTSALLAAGRPLLSRSAKYHRPRGPFCLQSSCGSCLVRVDGAPNVRACETACRPGLRVETQNAFGGAAHDLLGAIDLFSPHGIDHHHMATWSQVVNRVAVQASRQLSGLGHLPDQVPAARPPAEELRIDALVVGSGPAGLGAAEALVQGGLRVLLCEQDRALGGRLRCRMHLPGDPPLAWPGEVARAVERAGGRVEARAPVLGLWRDGTELLAAVDRRGAGRMLVVRAPRAVLASGTWAQPPLFPGNDLPGVHGARGLLVALAEDGVVPGERAAVLGQGPEAEAVAERLVAAGMQAERVEGEVARGRGGRRLAALDLADGRRLRCDTLAVATPRMPAAELARAAGAHLELDPATGAFRVKPGPAGLVAPGVWAAGEVCGPCTAAAAVEAGLRAGEAASRG
ncbi:MAG: (2Fe-2S)-binding protein [Deltaproteobacteria bacterium]|nr:(2Fe-2S)-binding protein [Deltaproteobacteria bacterium]